MGGALMGSLASETSIGHQVLAPMRRFLPWFTRSQARIPAQRILCIFVYDHNSVM